MRQFLAAVAVERVLNTSPKLRKLSTRIARSPAKHWTSPSFPPQRKILVKKPLEDPISTVNGALFAATIGHCN